MDFEVSSAEAAEAIHNFLAYASDQIPHAEREDVELAAYVGRRLEQAWCSVEFAVTMWLQERFPHSHDGDAGRGDVLARLKRGAPRRADTTTLMGRLLRATGDVLHDELLPALENDDEGAAAIAWYLARRWFTKYRVLKWRWLEHHREQIPAYQWFEA